jgi:hypothetical protein
MDLPDGRKPYYEDTETGVALYDAPRRLDGYDVLIGRGGLLGKKPHFCISRGMLEELTKPKLTIKEMLKILNDSTNGKVRRALSKNSVSPYSLQIALLHIKVKLAEQERDEARANN